jgi:hypothetical protein
MGNIYWAGFPVAGFAISVLLGSRAGLVTSRNAASDPWNSTTSSITPMERV